MQGLGALPWGMEQWKNWDLLESTMMEEHFTEMSMHGTTVSMHYSIVFTMFGWMNLK